jgi:hypothetical protein
MAFLLYKASRGAFPSRLKPWADSYVNGCAVNIIIQFFNVLYAPKWEFGLLSIVNLTKNTIFS